MYSTSDCLWIGKSLWLQLNKTKKQKKQIKITAYLICQRAS